MRLQKTDQARQELQPGVRTLGQRERSLLLMADGLSTASYLSSLFQGDGEKLVLQLLHQGYLSAVDSQEAPSPAPGAPDVAQAVSADRFDGNRSLATTRMFLFDLCERMFAKRSPAQAAFFRERLRGSRDRASMLEAAHEMLLEIENIAGQERADSIRERIAKLLPLELSLQ